MSTHARSSRLRYEQYRRDFKSHQTEGTSRTAAGHAIHRTSDRKFLDLLRSFFGLLGRQRAEVCVALGLVTISTLLGLVPPYGTKLVVDNVLDGKPLSAGVASRLHLPLERGELLATVALGIIGFSMAALAFGMTARWLATRTTKRVQVDIRRRVFEHAVRLPLDRIQKLKSGGVTSILREDAGGVADLIFGMLYNPCKAIIQLCGSLIILMLVDWRLLLGSLVLIPTVYLTHKAWISRIRPLFRDIRATRQTIDSHATESFGGMRVVRAFARQRSEATRFTTGNHLLARKELLAWWWSRGVDIAWSIMIPGASAALLWYGGAQILKDKMRVVAGEITSDQALTTGALVMFLAYVAWLLGPLATLANSATTVQNSLAGLDRVLDLMGEPTELSNATDGRVVEPGMVEGRITIRNVNFRYPGHEALVLQDISLDVAPGNMVALVGPSGAGKTTLSNLVARFYDPCEGSIELDGMDLRKINVESYRGFLGVVEQDIFLFDGTVSENIGYGRRGASREDIIEVARLAHAHEFVSEFAHGYDTLIGERGVRLSGGQRQRIAIARAMLAEPRILILDEATSNLDTESERYIQDSLQRLMAGCTSFVIAHRLSTIAHADLIVVIDHGRIIEQGSHEELMARSGAYERMVLLQTSSQDGPADPDASGDAAVLKTVFPEHL